MNRKGVVLMFRLMLESRGGVGERTLLSIGLDMPSLSERLLEVSMLLRLLCRGLWCWTVVLGGVAVVSYGLRIAVVRAMKLGDTV